MKALGWVWVVGMATLSTPVGAPSLGNYIFLGLQTRNWVAVLFGCVFAAALAIVLDLLIRLLEVAAARRSHRLAWLAAFGLSVIVIGGLFPAIGSLRRPETTAAQSPRVATQTQDERPVLADCRSSPEN